MAHLNMEVSTREDLVLRPDSVPMNGFVPVSAHVQQWRYYHIAAAPSKPVS